MADIKSEDYYKVLGVSKDADEKAIKNAYRKLAIKWHPDKNLDNKETAEENFKRIGEAYEVLSDPEKRKMYDQVGKAAFNGGASGFQGQQGFAHAEDIFAQFFGGRDPFTAFFGNDFSGFSAGGSIPGGSGFMFQTVNGMPGGFSAGMSSGGLGIDLSDFVGMNRTGDISGNRRVSSPKVEAPPNTLKPGTPVLMKGLVSAVELNGTYGTVVGYDVQSNRYQVRCLEEENLLSLRYENIQQLVRRVKLVGVQSRPELNGVTGDLVDFNTQKNRAEVRVPRSRAVISFKPDSVILPIGTVVRIFGLSGTQMYNGCFATVHAIDNAAGRYLLKLDDNHSLRVKFGNVKP